MYYYDNWMVGGMVKGVGMLVLLLVIMLCVFIIDVVVELVVFEWVLCCVVVVMFDWFDIDGSCFINDIVLLLLFGVSEIFFV